MAFFSIARGAGSRDEVTVTGIPEKLSSRKPSLVHFERPENLSANVHRENTTHQQTINRDPTSCRRGQGHCYEQCPCPSSLRWPKRIMY